MDEITSIRIFPVAGRSDLRCGSMVCLLAFLSGLSPVSAFAQSPGIASVTPSQALRSAPVTIAGSNLGIKRDGCILIGGKRAWTTLWSDRQIVAYIPEDAALGPAEVRLVRESGATAISNVIVQARPPAQPAADGTVAWRFEVLANYISHRADVARDGTVYFNDSSGFLYALDAGRHIEVGLRWRKRRVIGTHGRGTRRDD